MDRDRAIVELAVIALLLLASLLEPVSPGETRLSLSGGFTVLRIQLPGIEVFPALTGDLEVHHGLFDGVDLRARYTTHLGLVHRLGPELRASLVSDEPFSLITRVFPSLQFTGAAQRGVDFGGEVSTLFGLGGAVSLGETKLIVEAGATVEWLVFQNIKGASHTDATPYLAFADFALMFEWPSSVFARLELAYSLSRGDPFTIFGFVPRVLFGTSFSP